MARKRDPLTGQLMIEGITPVVSDATGRVTYRARYTYGAGKGRRYTSRSFKTYDAAADWLLSQRLNVSRGTHVDVTSMTVEDYYHRWYSRRERVLTQNRLRDIISVWERHIEPVIGDVRLQRLTKAMCQSVIDRMDKHGIAPRSIVTYMATLRTMLRAAVQDGILHVSPCENLVYPRAEPAQRTIWTPLQMRTFLTSIKDDPDAALWSLLLATGCRIGEALALEWDDVDLNEGTIHFHRTQTYTIDNRLTSHSGTKTNAEGRVVPIDGWVLDRLREMETSRSSAIVFCDDMGELRHPNTVRRRWKQAIARAGVPEIRLHDVRHSVATALIRDGVGVKVISGILGHKDIRTTLEIYAHVDTSYKREGIGAMSRLLGVAHDNIVPISPANSTSVSERVSD